MRITTVFQGGTVSRFFAAILTVVGIVSASPAAALLLNWTLSGPGATQVLTNENSTVFTYFLTTDSTDVQSWTAEAIAPATGTYRFNWSFGGFHGFSGGTAFAEANNPDTPLASSNRTSSGFSFSDRDFRFTVTEGETFGFTFGGSATDRSQTLSGQFAITAVPVPAALGLMLMGLAALGATAHRRKA